MHFHRLIALVGVIIGVFGLFFSGLKTDGEAALVPLSQASDSFPDGIPTIWGGLDAWAQVVLVILILATIGLAVRGDRSQTYDGTSALITAVIGVALMGYAVIKRADAADSAETLQGGFAQAAAAGTPGIAAWEVAVSVGFFVLILGTVLVAIGGVMSRIKPAG